MKLITMSRSYVEFSPVSNSKSFENCRVAVKRERTGARDFQIHDLATMPFRAVEQNNFVAARAAGHPRRVFLAWPFDENLRLPSDEILIFACADFVDGFEQLLISFLANFLRDLIRHFGSGRVATRRVFENVG